MKNNATLNLKNSPLKKKANDILAISRNLSLYLREDLSLLKNDGSEDPNIYFSGDLVYQSESLIPLINTAELKKGSLEKHHHISSVKKLTHKLYKNCKRLETCNSNGKEYVTLLKSELKKFRQLQYIWSLTL